MPSLPPPSLQIRSRVLERPSDYDLPMATDPLAFTPGLQQSLGQLDELSDEDIHAWSESIAAEQAQKNAEAYRLSQHHPIDSPRTASDQYDRSPSSSTAYSLGSRHSIPPFEASTSFPPPAQYQSGYNNTPFSLTPSPASSYGGRPLPSPTHVQPSSADSYYPHPMYSPQQHIFQPGPVNGADLHGTIIDSVQQAFLQRSTPQQRQQLQRMQQQQYSSSFASSSSLRNALQPVPPGAFPTPDWSCGQQMNGVPTPNVSLPRRSSVPTVESTTAMDPSRAQFYSSYHRPSSETAWYTPSERPPP